ATASGSRLTSTTASGPIWSRTPSNTGSETRAKADEEGRPERGEAAHLRVALVQQVLDARGEVERLEPPGTLREPVLAADVHPRVAAVVDPPERLPLPRDRVRLGERSEEHTSELQSRE